MELLEEPLVSASDSILEGLCVVLYTFGFIVSPTSQSVVAHCSKQGDGQVGHSSRNDLCGEMFDFH